MRKNLTLFLFGTMLALPTFAQQLICFTSYVSAFDFFSPITQLPDRELLITNYDGQYSLTIATDDNVSDAMTCRTDRSTSYLLRLYCGDETIILDYPSLNEGKVVPLVGFADQKLVCRDLSKLASLAGSKR